jgi:hypothetical protein
VLAAGEVEGKVEAGLNKFEVRLVTDPVLVAAGVPAGEVTPGNGCGARVGGLLEGVDDFGVGGAFVHEAVDEVAELAWESCDPSGAAVMGFFGGVADV